MGSKDMSFRFECGLSKPACYYKVENKDEIVKSMHLRLTILSRKAELDQISDGLNDNGLLSVLKKYPSEAINYFMQSGGTGLVQAVHLQENIYVAYSDNTEKKNEEKKIMEWWHEYISDVESKF